MSERPLYDRKLTPELRRQIERRIAEGKGNPEIAQEFGVSRRQVQYCRPPAGVPKRPRVPESVKAQIVERYRSGVSAVEVCAEFGIANPQLYKYLRDAGVESRSKAGLEASTYQRIQNTIRQQWYTVPAACGAYRLDKGELCRWLREGRIRGAFKIDDSPNSPWLLPRRSLAEFLAARNEGKPATAFLEQIALSARCSAPLRRAGILQLGELTQWTAEDLLALPEFSYKALDELRRCLRDHGLAFKPSDPDAQPPPREKPVCTEPGCSRIAVARRLCPTHYWRLRRSEAQQGE